MRKGTPASRETRPHESHVGRTLMRGGTLGAGIVLGAVLLVIVNYFGWKYHARADWTSERIYSLSEKSEQVVESLDREVRVTVFLTPESPFFEPVSELLDRYEAASPHISVRTIDPERNLLEAQRLVEEYGVETFSVVFEAGEERRVIEEPELGEFAGFSIEEMPRLEGFKGEQVFTGALLELVEGAKPRVLFTTGHGERRLDDLDPRGLSEVAELLGEDNFELEEWSSLGEPRVPEGTDLVVVAGPTASFAEPELAIFGEYLAAGGRMLVTLDSSYGRQEAVGTGLPEWLRGYGVDVGDDLVVDPARTLPFYSAETLFVESYGEAPPTRALRQLGTPVIVSAARSVVPLAAGDGTRVSTLMETSPEGWAERDAAELASGEIERGENDLGGPVPLGVVVEEDETVGEGGAEEAVGGASSLDGEAAAARDPELAQLLAETSGDRGGPMRLAVFGDTDFAANRLMESSTANRVLVGDTLNWLVDRRALLGIPSKDPREVRLSLSRNELYLVWALVLLALPGLAVATGVFVYLRRRR